MAGACSQDGSDSLVTIYHQQPRRSKPTNAMSHRHRLRSGKRLLNFGAISTAEAKAYRQSLDRAEVRAELRTLTGHDSGSLRFDLADADASWSPDIRAA